MEDQKFAPSVHETTHSHAWMIALLVGCLALIIALAGLFAYRYYQPQNTDVAEVGDDVNDADEVTENIQTKTFTNFSSFPIFEYPEDWMISILDLNLIDDSYTGQRMHISYEPIWFCEGCEGPITPITMYSALRSEGVNDTATMISSWVDHPYAENFEYVELGSDDNGTMTKYSAHIKSEMLDEYDVVGYFYEANTYISNVEFSDYDEDQTDNDAWEIIKNSLDFRQVK